jgi:hypothetical protein
MLDPTRQAMPADLQSMLAELVAAWDRGDIRVANALLNRATALAARDGYL